MMVALLPLAALGEIIGYRRIYIWGLVLFTAASLLCAVAWSLPTLVMARFLQGLGGAGIMSVNTALIRFIYPTRSLGRGVGLNTLIVAIAFTVGPSVASGILAIAPWPWLFAVNVPLGGRRHPGPALAAAHALSSHAFDLRSAVLNAAAFGLLILAIGEGAHQAQASVVGLELAPACSADCSCSNCRIRRRCCRWTCSAIPCSRSRRSPPCAPSPHRAWPSSPCPSSSITTWAAARSRSAC
jgi:DHA2 family multidrug resistance protein-like MFS transporter